MNGCTYKRLILPVSDRSNSPCVAAVIHLRDRLVVLYPVVNALKSSTITSWIISAYLRSMQTSLFLGFAVKVFKDFPYRKYKSSSRFIWSWKNPMAWSVWLRWRSRTRCARSSRRQVDKWIISTWSKIAHSPLKVSHSQNEVPLFSVRMALEGDVFPGFLLNVSLISVVNSHILSRAPPTLPVHPLSVTLPRS